MGDGCECRCCGMRASTKKDTSTCRKLTIKPALGINVDSSSPCLGNGFQCLQGWESENTLNPTFSPSLNSWTQGLF